MKSSLIQTFMRFGISGGLSTSLHWCVMALLTYFQLTSPEIATGIGALTGAVLNYFLQYHFTFKTQREHKLAVPAYILVASLGWVLNFAIFWLLHSKLALIPAVAQVLTTGIVTVSNFILYKTVVFHEHTESHTGS